MRNDHRCRARQSDTHHRIGQEEETHPDCRHPSGHRSNTFIRAQQGFQVSFGPDLQVEVTVLRQGSDNGWSLAINAALSAGTKALTGSQLRAALYVANRLYPCVSRRCN